MPVGSFACGGGVRVGALSLAFVLAVAGCGGGDSKSDDPPTPGKTATAAPTPKMSAPLAVTPGPARVELVALSRTSDKVVTGRFKVVNQGTGAVDLTGAFGETGAADNPGLGDPLSVSGIGLLDGRANKLYMPLQKASGGIDNCLCSRLHRKSVEPGGSLEIYADFPAPPADVQRVTVTMPLAVAMQDVPISPAPAAAPPERVADPATTPLAAPRILDITAVSEGFEQSVDDVAGNRAVRLSSDVLFAINKADLTPRANALLQQLAKQIDASSGATVKVDGYTDTTGNDTINQPLSTRRAQVVADKLKGLVTRQGVTFAAAGHGSKDPVASNDTDEGRRKNRRTTVSFSRPKPPPAPVSGKPYDGSATTVIGSASFTAAEAKGLKMEINSVHRDESGLVVLVWTLRNTGSGSPNVETKFDKTPARHGSYPPRRGPANGGVMLLDPAAKVRFEPLYSWSGACMCTAISKSEAKKTLGPGESVIYTGVYKPTAEVRTVDIQAPWDKPDDANVQGVQIR